jgi:hypothetical protein
MIKLMKLNEYNSYTAGANPDELNIDTQLLDKLVELVGSEEDVEMAASAAFEELADAAGKDAVEMSEEDIPEKLAIAALVVKLVELGKIGPEEADEFIADNLD